MKEIERDTVDHQILIQPTLDGKPTGLPEVVVGGRGQFLLAERLKKIASSCKWPQGLEISVDGRKLHDEKGSNQAPVNPDVIK